MTTTLTIRCIGGQNYHLLKKEYATRGTIYYCGNLRISKERYLRGLKAGEAVIK